MIFFNKPLKSLRIRIPVSMIQSLVFVSFFIFSTQAAEVEVEVDIKNINVTLIGGNSYKVNGDIIFELTDTLREALIHGVTLKSDIDFNLGEHRSWWWNSSKTISTLGYELKYHALSKHYILDRVNTKQHWTFSNLPIALKQMGRLREHRLPVLPAKINDGNHYIYITATIGAEIRGLPFKIQNYLRGSKYQIKSEGVLWALP